MDVLMFKGRAYPIEEFQIQRDTDYTTATTSNSLDVNNITTGSMITIKMLGQCDSFMQNNHQPTTVSFHLKDKENFVFHQFMTTMIERVSDYKQKFSIEATCKSYDKISA